MKAITLWQPWATLIIKGFKKIETRSWAPYHFDPRSPLRLAIHAAAAIPSKDRLEIEGMLTAWPFAEDLGDITLKDLPRGCILGYATVVEIFRTENWTPEKHRKEFYYGNYAPCRYGWVLEDIEELPEPIPAKGAQLLWEWPPLPIVTALPASRSPLRTSPANLQGALPL